MAEIEKTFVVEKICPVCEKEFRVVKTRSRLMVTKRDDDGCTHYEDFNPYYYTVWVCEHCGFAADEATFTTKIPDKHLTILRAVLLTKNIKIPFAEERTLENAATAFRLAIKFQELIRGKSSKRAKYAHQMAWIYREAGDKTQENECLAKAVEFYEDALMRESFPIGELTDNAVMYLVAAIYNRLGDRKKATSYLSKLISDQGVREREPRIHDKARDLWGDMRAASRRR
ncbi:MAG: DUF2225 domain-containing protein [Selenomonadaceae bacterium]|nr:DUF2225 domain-containing protein [Selenomonadaceae bacterium]